MNYFELFCSITQNKPGQHNCYLFVAMRPSVTYLWPKANFLLTSVSYLLGNGVNNSDFFNCRERLVTDDACKINQIKSKS